jgi:glycine cleavage system regulatory protein
MKKPKPEIAKTKPINIVLQEDLIKRITAFCAEQEITIHEFVTDAIIEKLNLVYKERRKKGRL